MSVGKTILRLRMQSKKSQRTLAESAGLAVSYVSRLENGHVIPTIRTLAKIAAGLGVPITSLLDSVTAPESADRCPVSLSGRCILDQLFIARGRSPKMAIEGYSTQQLEVLRLCNLLLHTRNRDVLLTLATVLKALLKLSESRATQRS
jgi:transcriptional regulator with XRE-family HTH domain